MDDHLKELMERLGHAINESISDSESIAETIGEIKHEGYDVYLVLQATIGFSRRDDETAEGPEVSMEFEGTTVASNGEGFTEQDQAFLKALKIKMEE